MSSAVGIAIALVACSPWRSGGEEAIAPRSDREVATLVAGLRTFEQRIGFHETRNFLRFEEQRAAFPFCGYASRFYLPYSYQDPAIKWADATTAEECSALAESVDVFFGESEAIGESETPITAAMRSAPLSRLLYLVIHEDCHDQFDLPYGIEEPLCDVIAYSALADFAKEQYGWLRGEYLAAHRYAAEGSRYARATIRFYDQLALFYARHEKLNTLGETVLREREGLLKRAARVLGWEDGALNNVLLANAMTYSRHYPFVEDVFDALGRDVARTVAFFKEVDAARPSPAEVMDQRALDTDESVDFLRAYETSVVQTAKKLLQELRFTSSKTF